MALRDQFDLAERQHQEIDAADMRLLRDLAFAYLDVQGEVLAELEAVNQKIAAARTGGETVGREWLFQQRRLARLREQVEAQLLKYGRYAGPRIISAQRQAAELAQQHALRLVEAGVGSAVSLPTWSRLPVEAIESLVGHMATGEHIQRALDRYAPVVAKEISRSLVVAVGLGYNPNKVASRLRREFGGKFYQYARIARTEQLNAYRRSSLEGYRQNTRVVKGWRWHAPRDERTCSYCLGRHGQEYGLDVEFVTHPNCRCAPLPLTRSWGEVFGIREVA